MYLRLKLQRFMQQKDARQPKDFQNADAWLRDVERFDITLDLFRETKIGKLIKHMCKMELEIDECAAIREQACKSTSKRGGGGNLSELCPMTTEATEAAGFKVGDHIYAFSSEATQPYVGKIAFLGPTEFSEGEWAGIELFEVGAGKHNGTFQDVRYFTCPDNTGVLIPAYKMHRLEYDAEGRPIIRTDAPGSPAASAEAVPPAADTAAEAVAEADAEAASAPEQSPAADDAADPAAASEAASVAEAASGAEAASVAEGAASETAAPAAEPPSAVDGAEDAAGQADAKALTTPPESGKTSPKAAAKPSSAKPAASKTASKPAAAKASPAKVAPVKSAGAKPAAAKPAAAKPAAAKPAAAKPAAVKPPAAAAASATGVTKPIAAAAAAAEKKLAVVEKRPIVVHPPDKKPAAADKKPAAVDKKQAAADAKPAAADAKPAAAEKKPAAADKKPVNGTVAPEKKPAAAPALKPAATKPAAMAKSTPPKPSAPAAMPKTPRSVTKVSSPENKAAASPAPKSVSPVARATSATTAAAADVQVFKDRITALEAENEALIKKIGAIQETHLRALAESDGSSDETLALKQELARLTEHNSALEQQVASLAEQVAALTSGSSETAEQLRARTAASAELEERLSEAAEKAAATTAALSDISDKYAAAEAELAKIRDEFATAASEREELTAKVKQLAEEHAQRLTDALDAARAEADAALAAERASAEAARAELAATVDALKREHELQIESVREQSRSFSEQSNQQIVQELEAAKTDFRAQVEIVASLKQQLDERAQLVASLEASNIGLSSELSGKDALVTDKINTIASFKAELDDLRAAHAATLEAAAAAAAGPSQREILLQQELDSTLAAAALERREALERYEAAMAATARESATVQQLRVELDASKDKFNTLNATLDELTAASDVLMVTMQQKDARIAEFEGIIATLKTEAANNADQAHAIHELEKQRAELGFKLSQAELSIKTKDELISDLVSRADEHAAAEQKRAEHATELERALSAIASKDQAFAELAIKLEQATMALAAAEEKAASKTVGNAEASAAVAAANAAAEEQAELFEATISQKNQALQRFQVELAEALANLETARQEIDSLEGALADAQQAKASNPAISQEDIQQLEEESLQKDALIDQMRNQFQDIVNDFDAQILINKQLKDQVQQVESALADKAVLLDLLSRQSQERAELDQARFEQLQQAYDEQRLQLEHLRTLLPHAPMSIKPTLDAILEEDDEVPMTPMTPVVPNPPELQAHAEVAAVVDAAIAAAPAAADEGQHVHHAVPAETSHEIALFAAADDTAAPADARTLAYDDDAGSMVGQVEEDSHVHETTTHFGTVHHHAIEATTGDSVAEFEQQELQHQHDAHEQQVHNHNHDAAAESAPAGVPDGIPDDEVRAAQERILAFQAAEADAQPDAAAAKNNCKAQ
nr:Dynactin subunit 1 [Polyrhizophydium stewartii]